MSDWETTIIKTRLYKKRGYIIVYEFITSPGNLWTELKSAYSWPDLYYIGDSKTAYRRWKNQGIIKFYPHHDYEPIKELDAKEKVKRLLKGDSILQLKNSPVCLIGWSERDQKWYGWARGIWGFEPGSEVKKGHVAYQAANKEDWIEDQLRFWGFDIDGNYITSFDEDEYISSKVLKQLKIDDINDNKKGITVEIETTFRDTELLPVGNVTFIEYPKEWGRGEWVAKTMEDAREMACDYAEGCS